MKLLIVDDEELTREGLIASINWNALGINEIFQADDGVNGLEVAKAKCPDIVLCDVRMPRMTGIDMLEQIEQVNPKVAAIFMSGYSDKEYLKAAIKLKAVNYIEKPIDTKEMEQALRHAVEQVAGMKKASDAEAISKNEVAQQLAFQLTVPYQACQNVVDGLCEKFYQHYGADKFKNVTTFIVKLENLAEATSELPFIFETFRNFLAPCHLHVIYSEKRLYHIVFHVYGEPEISKNRMKDICGFLSGAFERFGGFYIAVGDQVRGIENAYHSYESAVILLQSSFFYETGTVLSDEMLGRTPVSLDAFSSLPEQYYEALGASDKDKASVLLENISSTCVNAVGILPNQVKSIYFNLFSNLYKARRDKQLIADNSIENQDNIMDIMDGCFAYEMLHELLLEKNDKFFEDVSSLVPENSTIYLIKNYIATNFDKPDLSVKDISDYAHMSVSYVCTFFKNETGMTLNQYITDYRMEKAKQLLLDPRFKVTDISSKVGYNDGNYFGKSFKKMVGLSPSEYREKVQK